MGVIGLYTCSCHEFDSYEAADKAARQKFNPGDTVKNRHTQKIGTITGRTMYDEHPTQYYSICYGPLPRDNENIHPQEAILISKSK